MDIEIIRFKIDPTLREAAAKVCGDLGLELNDVLRAFVTRIARDGRLPFELATLAPSPPGRPGPFEQYDPRLWSTVRPPVDADIAVSLLARFVAACSRELDELSHARSRDEARAAQLRRDRAAALDLRRGLDVTDAEAIRRVIATYGPLVRSGGG